MFRQLVRAGLMAAMVLWAAVFVASAQGKKYALLVGINNYQGGISKLRGAVNDVDTMNGILVQRFGFASPDIVKLTDLAATRNGILSNLRAFQAKAKDGDLFVMTYSGHGTLFPDKYSALLDETKEIYMEEENEKGEVEVVYPKGTYDSAIVPVDALAKTSGLSWGNLILDDELYEILGDITRRGASVVFLSDSCHSGSVGRAAGETDAVRKMTTLKDIYGVKAFSDIDFDTPANQRAGKVAPPEPGRYIVLSAAQDNEYALDVRKAGAFGGLFTITLAQVLNEPGSNKLTYSQLMSKVTPLVKKDSAAMDNDQNPASDFGFGNANAPIFSLPSSAKKSMAVGNDDEIKSTLGRKGAKDSNIKSGEPVNNPKASTERKATKNAGAVVCSLDVVNNTPWVSKVYFSGVYGGTLAPWSSYVFYLNPGSTKVYGRADFTDGTYRFWTMNYDCGGGSRFLFSMAP